MQTHPNKCWYRISTPIKDYLNQGFVWPTNKVGVATTHVMDTSDIFSKEFMNWLESNGLRSLKSALFYTEGGYAEGFAHIDGPDIHGDHVNIFALNLALGIDDREMVFFHSMLESTAERKIHNASGKNDDIFYAYPILTDKVIDRCNIGDQLTLVRIDTPHWISFGPTSRRCISIRIRGEPEFNNWDNSVKSLTHVLMDRP